ncbi:cell wall metabolism sensor histidine kinase WalK [Paenibacillus sp. PAMC21692]|uniref:sensor histidine kinase n=1 Tax=Paenibacillus sp. PAMC21692 TaxID=2762320 RepID=UPI00164E0CD9|nr:HAMP domain-containing sensor histidine kinase [Paenibacillus sp. PAMC21692]QNK56691.1 HAMP domain-containing histidine kinase [Paenibacillus sp. PAMC21692]
MTGAQTNGLTSGRGRNGLAKRLRLVAISIATALLTGWIVQIVLLGMESRERERAELYWNGYAVMYVELNGGFDGLQERLVRDGYVYGADSDFAVRIYAGDDDHYEKVAEVSRGGKWSGGRKLPVMTGGRIVGYTETSITSFGHSWFIRFVVPCMTGLFVLTCGLILQHKLNRTEDQADRRLAEELKTYMAQHRHLPVDTEERDWTSLKGEIGDLMRRNQQLETVRTTMVADIAHELRTPIAIMRATLDHALQSGAPLAPDKLAVLHDETLRLSRLVRDLKELALAESGHLPLFKSWFSMTELAEEVLETLSAAGEERGIRHVITGLHDATMYGDRGRIKQLLINLVGNAFRHARSLVTVDLALAGGMIQLTVSDDGPGIEEEELERVFDRFYRGTETAKAGRGRGTGLGLGLAIVREFARAHGGETAVRSRYGEGASFVVTLPVMKE